MRFTKRSIEALPYAEDRKRPRVIFDSELPGFGIRVGLRSRTYFVQRDVGGKTVKLTLGRHGVITAEQARRDAQQMLAKLAAGENPNEVSKREAALRLTLSEAFESYLHTRSELRDSTKRDYTRAITRHLNGWADVPIVEITGQMVAERHRELASTAGKVSANHAMRVLRAVYNMAKVDFEDLPENPVRRLSLTRSWYRVRRRQRIVADHHLAVWFATVMALEHSTPRDFLRLLLFTGLRRTEAARLQWEDIDFENRTLTIDDTKNHDPHSLPLSDFLVDLLMARYRDRHSDNWVFPGSGKSGFYQDPKKAISIVKAASGVEFSSHDLRRTFITIAERLDIPAYALKRLLNHRSRDDVTSGYIIVNVERLRGPMQRISDHLIVLCEGHQNEQIQAFSKSTEDRRRLGHVWP